jgi:hypothetical protein
MLTGLEAMISNRVRRNSTVASVALDFDRGLRWRYKSGTAPTSARRCS